MQSRTSANYAHRAAPAGPTRRELLRSGVIGLGVLASGTSLFGCRQFDIATGSSGDPPLRSLIASLGPLETEPDANGLRLPAGFTSRVVARSGVKPVETADYLWHPAPDGGGVFPAEGGG